MPPHRPTAATATTTATTATTANTAYADAPHLHIAAVLSPDMYMGQITREINAVIAQLTTAQLN